MTMQELVFNGLQGGAWVSVDTRRGQLDMLCIWKILEVNIFRNHHFTAEKADLVG